MRKREFMRIMKGLWMLGNLKIWVASAIPMAVGGALSYGLTKRFSLYWFIASFVGICLIEMGKHAINELIDYVTGVDLFVAPDKRTPFSGGRRTIVDGILTVPEILLIGVITMAVAAALGLYIVFFREPSVLWIGLAGFTISIFYSLPPFKFAYNGLGELAVGITYGPLILLGTYLVQTHTLALIPFLVSIPIGILITNVLWINQFPDYEADRQGNKRNWVVRLGKEKSVWVFAALYILTYLSIILLAVATRKPLWLISLFTLPIAVQSFNIAKKHYNDIPNMIGANVKTIIVYVLAGILFSTTAILNDII